MQRRVGRGYEGAVLAQETGGGEVADGTLDRVELGEVLWVVAQLTRQIGDGLLP